MAFGCILYECLTAKRVCEGETVTETLAAIFKGEPGLGRIPARLRPLLQCCLEWDPKKRLPEKAMLCFYRPGGGLAQQLMWVDRQGNAVKRVGEPGIFAGLLALAPDDKRAALRMYVSRGVNLFDFAREIRMRFTFKGGYPDSPVWFPDGSRILFSSSAWRHCFSPLACALGKKPSNAF